MTAPLSFKPVVTREGINVVITAPHPIREKIYSAFLKCDYFDHRVEIDGLNRTQIQVRSTPGYRADHTYVLAIVLVYSVLNSNDLNIFRNLDITRFMDDVLEAIDLSPQQVDLSGALQIFVIYYIKYELAQLMREINKDRYYNVEIKDSLHKARMILQKLEYLDPSSVSLTPNEISERIEKCKELVGKLKEIQISYAKIDKRREEVREKAQLICKHFLVLTEGKYWEFLLSDWLATINELQHFSVTVKGLNIDDLKESLSKTKEEIGYLSPKMH